jgi:2'-5' RNA ligase
VTDLSTSSLGPSSPSLPVGDGVPHGLFFAVFPDGTAARRIAERVRGLRSRHGLTGAGLATDRFHVSLKGLAAWEGAPPPALVADAGAAAASLDLRAFDVQFDFAMSFKGSRDRRPFVLVGGEGVVGLEMLKDQLDEAIARRTGIRAPRAFTPHLTLLYDRKLVAEHPIEPIRWTVRALVLVESLRGQGLYIRRGVWPLD